MIIRDFYETREDGVNLYRSYSDEGYVMLQIETGAKYDIAIDVEDAPFTYEETDELVNKDIAAEIIAPDEISAEELMALMEEVL